MRNRAYKKLQDNRALSQLAISHEELHASLLATQDRGLTPATAFQQAEERKRIDDAIAALPPGFREVIVLRYLDGLSYKEIAEIAEVPTGTVMSRRARVRTWLKRFLEPVQSVDASC